MVREVPTPLSPSPAPFLLRAWAAQVERIDILLSKAVSNENTPTKTPAGGSVSKFSGGNDGGSKSFGGKNGNEAVGGKVAGGGKSDIEGIVQYPLHGKDSLSGFKI